MTFVICYPTGMKDLTIEQLAMILGVTRQAIHYRIRQGKLPDGTPQEMLDHEIRRLEVELDTIRTNAGYFEASPAD